MLWPVSAFVMVTVAFGIAAPEGSCTDPRRVACVICCADAVMLSRTKHAENRKSKWDDLRRVVTPLRHTSESNFILTSNFVWTVLEEVTLLAYAIHEELRGRTQRTSVDLTARLSSGENLLAHDRGNHGRTAAKYF